MSRHFDRERELQRLIEATLAPTLPQVEVLEVELDEPRETVRLFVDAPEGVGFDLCTQVNDVIRDTCPDQALEVSSPGMERPLRSPQSFEAVIGEQVRLRRAEVLRARTVTVVAVDPVQGVTVQPADGETYVVPFDEIVRCRLVVKDFFAAAERARGAKKKGLA
ncbi:MAG: ribosome maturation factor RimP [Thermoleophilia bacterium]|nr:ribosome maturation factor RimP [Thermoleophilia bacterium]